MSCVQHEERHPGAVGGACQPPHRATLHQQLQEEGVQQFQKRQGQVQVSPEQTEAGKAIWLGKSEELSREKNKYRVSQKKRSLSFLAIISGLNAAIVAFKDSFELVRFSAFF